MPYSVVDRARTRGRVARTSNYTGIRDAAYRAARIASMNAFMSAVPYGRSVVQAVNAANMIKKAYQNYRATKGAKALKHTLQEKRSRKWAGSSTGTYAGKFKKARKTRRPKVETKCLAKGYHLTKEIYGRIDDPNCVYLMHNTSPAELISRAIAGYFIRKLLKLGGIQIDSKDAEIPFYENLNSDGFKIELVVQSPIDGSVAATSYITVQNDTLYTLVNNSTLASAIYNYMLNDTGNIPYQFNLYSSDRNALDTNWRLAASINMETEIISLYCSSTMMVQNRTSGSAAVDNLSADRVDNQPLVGYMYHFRNSDPRLRQINQTGSGVTDSINLPLGRAVIQGISLVRGAQLQTALSEPPVPKYWANCDKSSKIRLEPGAMKKSYISHKFHGKFKNVLFKLRAKTRNSDVWVGLQGRAQMIALEETLRTDSTNLITINYECEHKVGCFGKTKKFAPFSTELTSSNINNTA